MEIYISTSMRNIRYNCDGVIICCKKISNTINFIDIETDGINFSWTIKANFSKKNIELFLKSKFKSYKKK